MPFKNQHPLYSVWQNMKRRCDNPNMKSYKDYGGRGIYVCDSWSQSFKAFLDDMGPRPDGHSIDRIDNNGPYSPENCRWASKSEQQRNQRNTRIVIIDGAKLRACDLAESSGLKTDTIIERAERGLPYSEVIASGRQCSAEVGRKAREVAAENKRSRSHCANGHRWTAENTRITPQGWKDCRTCAREKARRYRAERSV